MNKIKVGITGTGSLIGQAIIKSIKISCLKKNLSLVGFDYFPETIGSFWVEKHYILPDILKNGAKESVWLKVLLQKIKSEDIRVLLIGLDFEAPLFAKYKETIEKNSNCIVVISSGDVAKIADDKYLTYQFLKNNGFYYPHTLLPKELDNQKIDFPCIVKPRKGCRNRDVFVVSKKHELKKIISVVKNPIIQELIGDPSQEYTCGTVSFYGKVKKIIVLRRKLKDGNTETAYFSKYGPQIIYDYVYSVAEKLQLFGPCNFQLRLDKNGTPKIFEINARHSGTTYIRALFGFNEIEYILSVLLGFKPKEFRMRQGMVKRYFDELFIKEK